MTGPPHCKRSKPAKRGMSVIDVIYINGINLNKKVTDISSKGSPCPLVVTSV